MHTLEALKSGSLKGSKHIKLACGLTTFPEELFSLADTLEILDLTDNALSTLPEHFHTFTQLKILFLSNNAFTHIPAVLSKCTSLSMFGIRNNHIDTLDENVLPTNLRWLILTDNHLKTLPHSIGQLEKLQKCMLSGNKLESLPKSLAHCKQLELLRISANRLTTLPLWLLAMPKLSWLAYSGNPFCEKHPSIDTPIKEIPWRELEIKELLGEGASGLVYRAIWQDKEVAVKIFKGAMTSDGLPQEEMDINIAMGQHPNLIDVLAKISDHPEGKDVLILELIPSHYFNLGLPPTFETCTRDVYPDGFTLSYDTVLHILKGIASAASHMHNRGIMHGDFYAHNIMIDTRGHSILGDFGGASYFEPTKQTIKQGLERLEVRAFACLVEELLLLCKEDKTNKEALIQLKTECLTSDTKQRPLFKTIMQKLEYISPSIS